MVETNQNNQILLEFFSGRSKELEKCEGYIREIIDIIKKDHEDKDSALDYINRDRHLYRETPANAKLEHELAKFFKIRRVRIHWATGTINAMSISPLSFLRPGYQNKLINDKYSNMSASLVLTENLIYHADLNEREILAIILHELGHCFYWCPITLVSTVLYLATSFPKHLIIQLVELIILKNALKLSQWCKEKVPAIYNVMNLITDYLSQIGSYITVAFGPVGVVKDIIQSIRNGSITTRFTSGAIVTSISGYGAEKGADSFAAKYGYGPELVSALTKMEKPVGLGGYKMAGKFGTFGDIMTDLSVLSYHLASLMTLDAHPSDDQRAQSMLRKLKTDLAESEFPPEMEEDLVREIARMEQALSVMHDNKSNVEIKKKWFTIVDKVTHGHNDIREILDFYFRAFSF